MRWLFGWIWWKNPEMDHVYQLKQSGQHVVHTRGKRADRWVSGAPKKVMLRRKIMPCQRY